MIRASAEHTRSEPRKIMPRRNGVRLTLELRAPERGAVGETGRLAEVQLAFWTRSTVRQDIWPHVFLEVRDAQHRSGLEKQDGYANVRKNIRHRPAARSGADDDDVVNGGARHL